MDGYQQNCAAIIVMYDNKLPIESGPLPRNFGARTRFGTAAYERPYERSIVSPCGFWREQDRLPHWIKPSGEVPDTNFDVSDLRIRWFAGVTLNAPVNCAARHLCVDRHLAGLTIKGFGER
jgi:hypothetical protein